MRKEKWIFNGLEIDIPVVNQSDIDNDINLDDTRDLTNAVNNMSLILRKNNLENTKKIDIVENE